MAERICHMFNWRTRDIINVLEEIANQGFTTIQIPSVQPFKNSYKDKWYWMYQPLGFDIGNEFGSRDELIELCNKAHSLGIKVIVDVIITHMAGDDYGNIVPHPNVDRNLVYRNIWKSFDRIYNWNDRYEVIHKSHGMPCIDLSKHEAQDLVVDFFNRLIDCGVDGLRLDSGKSIALPEEGSDFFIRVPQMLKKDLFVYAEVIFESKELIDKYCKYVNVLTSSYGSDKNRLVTFIDSHDLQHEFKVTTHYNSDTIKREYDILCSNFNMTWFYIRPFDDTWRSQEVRNSNFRNR